jgi:hypothetical protein
LADLGIAHLLMRQADRLFGSIDQRMRVVVPQTVKVWFVRKGDCIVVGIFAITEAVEDNQEDRGDFHCGVAFMLAF